MQYAELPAMHVLLESAQKERLALALDTATPKRTLVTNGRPIATLVPPYAYYGIVKDAPHSIRVFSCLEFEDAVSLPAGYDAEHLARELMRLVSDGRARYEGDPPRYHERGWSIRSATLANGIPAALAFARYVPREQ